MIKDRLGSIFFVPAYTMVSIIMGIIITQDKATSTKDLCDAATSTEKGHEHNSDTKHHSDPADDDSDATTLDLQISPPPSVEITPGDSSDGSTSMESVYEMDPDYSGPIPQSQPCQKHGVTYVPAGMRRTYVKKRKLNFDNCN